MKRFSLVATLIVAIDLFVGCSRPDSVTTIRSPTSGVFYTVETFRGHGAIDSDFTRVYAHFERNGKTKKILVLDGEYLTIAKVDWINPHEGTFCMKEGGITDTFRNQVTLILGDAPEDSATMHHHLDEQCDIKANSASP